MRTRALVVHAGQITAQVVLPAWMHGQVTVTVDTEDLVAVAGLSRQDLTGTEFSVVADLSAITDTDVNPHAWQLPATSGPIAA
ncbi:hypothetical protein [Streptomyces sp. NBC_01601]|uniref:hypothetical protein n=1 Tax=Streptomyces sp. NBC_01601 TaxID=2975892 RepID=UPI002E2A984C|nr:hypothetical protein [Streptomyces sp. NBC_01601]